MNQLYSKYMNNLLILLILLVIHFFALTYLTVEIAEVLPLDKYRENYPYDMVWMAKEEDEAFAEKLDRASDDPGDDILWSTAYRSFSFRI